MIRYYLVVIFLLLYKSLWSQIDLDYIPCPNGDCPPGATQQQWQTYSIISDFGMRLSNSKWHRGIDFNIEGETDYGYHLLSPINGEIAKIKVYSSYKVLSLRDNSGNNYNFGFGHIFDDYNPPIGEGTQVGSFILYHVNSSYFAIINVDLNTAFCEANGLQFNYNGIDYTTTNIVTIGQSIAPLGRSDASNGAHLHLYRFVNPSLTDLQDEDNCKDPLQVLNIVNTNYIISVSDKKSISSINDYVYYNGADISCLKVKCQFQNPTLHSSSGNICYDNVIMDIDAVDLLIKPSGEPNSSYKLFQGANTISKISHGARFNVNEYPDNVRDNYGDLLQNRTGIYPSAYNSSNTPWDEFIFSDLYTRIHKNNICGSMPTLWANNNDDAFLPDGYYDLAVRITNVKSIQQNNYNSPYKIKIDNFKPYIKKVEIRAGTISYSTLFYSASWKGISNNIKSTRTGVQYCLPSQDIFIDVTSSELLYNPTLSIKPSGLNLSALLISSNGNNYHYRIPAIQTAGWDPANPQLVELCFSGTDLAGNQLEAISFHPALPSNDLYAIPIRQNTTTWQPSANPGQDTYHKFYIGCRTGNYKGGEESTCLKADFELTPNVINSMEDVQFTNLSVGNPDTYEWWFENGTPEYSNDFEPIVKFLPGIQTVRLIVRNSEGSHQCIKDGYVISTEGQQPISDFSASSTTVKVGDPIQFFDQSLFNPTYWGWDFSDGIYSNLQNPVISYLTPGPKTVSLTTENQYGFNPTEHKTNYITVLPSDEPAIVECYIDKPYTTPGSYILFCAYLDNLSFDPTYSYTYNFNFGDGNTYTYTSSQHSACAPIHLFQTEGTYTLSVYVTNSNNQNVGFCTEALNIIDYTSPIVADFTYSPNLPVVGDIVNFTASSNASGNEILYSWIISKEDGSNYIPIDYKQGQTISEQLFSHGNYKINLSVSDLSGRPAAFVEKFLSIPMPQKCIIASYKNNPGTYRFEKYQAPKLTSNCFVTNQYYCIENNVGYNSTIITDIRCTMYENNLNFSESVHHYSPSGDPDPVFEFSNQLIHTKSYYVIEAWNRNKFSDANNYSVGTIFFDNNHLNQPYYDKIWVLVDLGLCDNGTKYICGSYSNNKHFKKKFIYAADHNDCSNDINSGAHVIYDAKECVTLREGFTASNGSDFTARLCCPISGSNTVSPGSSGSYSTSNLTEIDLFPNPANNYIYCKISNDNDIDYLLELSSVSGSIIGEYIIDSPETVINTSQLSPGVYIVKVSSNKSNFVSKIVIEP